MRFLLLLLTSVVAAYGFGAYLLIPANPEVKFWREVVERREAEIAEVRREHPDTPIIFFTGGSSCAFSIDPKIIEEECGLPAFNLGLPVSAGMEYITHQAMEQARSGDFLILCFELEPLTVLNSEGLTSFSLAMASAAGDPRDAAGGETFGSFPDLRGYLNFGRPGPRFTATLFGKRLLGQGYRYEHSDVRYRGRVETPIKNELVPRNSASVASLSHVGRDLLKSAAIAARKKGVRIAYSLPWHYTAADSLLEVRGRTAAVASQIGEHLPVIDDGYAGCVADPKMFSDTVQHLNAEGSRVRSEGLSVALAKWMSIPGETSRSSRNAF